MVQIELKTFLRLSFDPPLAEGLGMTSVMTGAFDNEIVTPHLGGRLLARPRRERDPDPGFAGDPC